MADGKHSSCLNCKTPLDGAFCHHCGQEDTHYVRGIGSLLTEFFGETGNWDGRVWRTLVPLFFRPAFLSNEYVRGRRVPYVPPLRLYLFISIVAFIIFSQVGSGLRFAGENITSEEQAAVYEDLGQGPRDNDLTRFSEGEQRVNLAFLSEEENAELNDKLSFLVANPKVLVDKFFSVAPQVLLLMLPIFALVLKLLYIFKKRYYIEHLILALHTHAFLLVAFMLLLIIGKFTSSDAPAMLSMPVSLTMKLIMFWIPIYLFIAQKSFYRQSWLVTFIKFNITGFIYIILLSAGAVGALILSIYAA